MADPVESKFGCSQCDFEAVELGPPFNVNQGTAYILDDNGHQFHYHRPHVPFQVLGIKMGDASQSEEMKIESRIAYLKDAICTACGKQEEIDFDRPPTKCSVCGSSAWRTPHRLLGLSCPVCHGGTVVFKGHQKPSNYFGDSS